MLGLQCAIVLCAFAVNSMLLCSQSKCAGTSLRVLLHLKTAMMPRDQVCIPSYTHEYNVLSAPMCGYEAPEGASKPAVMAGHFMWYDYDWMVKSSQVCA